jgi:sigma-B regulation protein RsbU (phosphoserine phosphatase)
MLFFSVLGILVIFFIVTYISNKLIQPLSNVTSQLKKFSTTNGDLALNTRNEVALVADSLDYLQAWYEKFKTDQTHEVKLSSQRKQDLIEASEIQMSLINNDFSAFSERKDIDLFAVYKPARIVSGDLFDFFFLDDDNLFFTIGDVSGKGLSAAFYMSVAQTLLKSNSRHFTPGKIVTCANNELYTVNQHQFFLTLFCGVLNIKTGFLKYCNAAHTLTTILSLNGDLHALDYSHGMPLGLHPGRNYEESVIKLKRGDSIVLFSDGVTDLQNENEQHYGNERFLNILKPLAVLKPKELIGEIEKDLELFKGKMKQTDDITIMVLKFKNKKKA